jgi:hypothetical protein
MGEFRASTNPARHNDASRLVRFLSQLSGMGGLSHRFIDIVAQQVPEFFHAAAEVRVSHASEVPRSRHIDRDDVLDDSRRRAQYRDAVTSHEGYSNSALRKITAFLSRSQMRSSSGRNVALNPNTLTDRLNNAY